MSEGLSLSEIAHLVAERHGLTVADLRGPSRARRVSMPRQEAMALSSKTGKWSRGQVGRYFNRTCWTVTHAEEQHAARIAAGQAFVAEQVANIVQASRMP